EDGIRDATVTGVQTCALPICNQVPALAGAGFQVIVPDLRGYGRSDKPAEVEAYRMPLLAMDVVGILDTLGAGRAHIVGHDWGAEIGRASCRERGGGAGGGDVG